jgi:hypothetical protein
VQQRKCVVFGTSWVGEKKERKAYGNFVAQTA